LHVEKSIFKVYNLRLILDLVISGQSCITHI